MPGEVRLKSRVDGKTWFSSLDPRLVGEFQIREGGEQVVDVAAERAVEIAKAVADEQAGDAGPEDPVVVEQGSRFETQAEVGADRLGDVVLEHERLQHVRGVEKQKVAVGDQAGPRGDLEVDAGVVELQPWVDEVRLRLPLIRGPQVGVDGEEVLETETEDEGMRRGETCD